MNAKVHSTFILNLFSRPDRRDHILRQFKDRKEFRVQIVEPVKHEVAAVSLWETIKHIIRDLANPDEEYIIFCEDDHEFTTHYSKESLAVSIEQAKLIEADVLSCGVSGFNGGVIPVKENIYWVQKFSGLQFTVIFRKFFQKILESDFQPFDAADYKICSLTENKFFVFPFISVQKDFGYSDVTTKNNQKGTVGEAFLQSEEKVQLVKKVRDSYTLLNDNMKDLKYNFSPVKVMIPTYVIHLPERIDRFEHIKKQFAERPEFDLTIVEACRHSVGAVGLWQSIQKIIEIGKRNDDDLLLICEDDHLFTDHYNRLKFIEMIWVAASLGCNVLSGGIGGFDTCIKVTENLYWIDAFWSTQFIVVFRRFFDALLNEPFSVTDTADDKISEMTSHKLVIHPFVSVQRDFGYSDVTTRNDVEQGLITSYFEQTNIRLKKYNKAAIRYANLMPKI